MPCPPHDRLIPSATRVARQQALKYHPDKNDATTQLFQSLETASRKAADPKFKPPTAPSSQREPPAQGYAAHASGESGGGGGGGYPTGYPAGRPQQHASRPAPSGGSARGYQPHGVQQPFRDTATHNRPIPGVDQ